MAGDSFEQAPAFDLSAASPEEQETLLDLERFIRIDPEAAKTVVDLYAKQSSEIEGMSDELQKFLKTHLRFGADVLFGITEVIKGQLDLNLDFDVTTRQAIKDSPDFKELDRNRHDNPEAAKKMRILRISTFIGRILDQPQTEASVPAEQPDPLRKTG
ncbi:MAG TPA: hypothetical protein VLE69_02300 [Candidatus Saccharimonadales bacterium]|nr:hypothetical protein [Candidatus Saccharimonadales bacterium]